jgi:hypothetical protein
MDLSNMSDDDLLNLYNQEKAKQPQEAPEWGPGAMKLPNGSVVSYGPKGGLRVLQKPVGADQTTALTKTDQDAIQGAKDKARTSLQTATQAQRFVDLNRRNATGPGAAISVGGFWGLPKVNFADLGAAMHGNADWQAMKSISSGTAPTMRIPGSGSSSDTDVRLMKEGFPSVTNYGDANVTIKKRFQADSNKDAAYAAFVDKWSQVRGNLAGADAAFGQWWAREGQAKYDTTQGRPAPRGPAVAPPARRPRPVPKPADDVESIVAKYR